MQSVKLLYLSGPMDNLSADEDSSYNLSMTQWRTLTENKLRYSFIDVINPVELPTDLTDRWIVEGDKRDIRESDVVIANVSQIARPGVDGRIVMGAGTLQEIIYAHELGKPVVVIDTTREPAELSVWIRQNSSIIFNSIQEACTWVVSLNNKKVDPEVYKRYCTQGGK